MTIFSRKLSLHYKSKKIKSANNDLHNKMHVNITFAVMTVSSQVKALIAAAGVVTASVLTQVNTAPVLIFTFIVV